MNALLVLCCLGLVAGVSLTVSYLPVFRRPTLSDRVTPYLGLSGRPSRLLMTTSTVTPWPTLEKLARPLLANLSAKLDSVLGGAESVRTRLDRLDGSTSSERFRLEQLLWGLATAFVASALASARIVSQGGGGWVPLLLLTGLGFCSGVLARDRMLTVAVRRRAAEMEQEFPTILELLALAVSAGEGMVAALERVSRVGQGPLVRELDRALNELRAGTPLMDALDHLAARSQIREVRRFVDALAVAIERGTPLADVLAAQAADARETKRRELIESGGRKEIAMMIPVVFLVLPLSVIFALFPGFYGLSLGTT